MVRRNAGRLVVLAPVQRGALARGLAGVALAAWTLGATPAGAARVSEVRVGTHDKITRIVLELDAPTGYSLRAPQAGDAPELVVQLEASSVPREVASKSRLVKSVRVEPDADSATVRVALATADVAVKELLLANPPRIVFDLTARGPIPKQTTPAEEVASASGPTAGAESKPAAEAEPSVVEAEPPTVPAPPAAEETRPAPAAVAAEKEASASKLVIPPPPGPELAAVADVPEAVAPALPAAEPVRVAQADSARMPRPPPPPPAPAAAPTPSERPAATSNAPARRDAIAAKAGREGAAASGPSIPALVTSRLGLAVIVGILTLVGAIAWMRRRRAAGDEDPLYTVMSADDAGSTASEAGAAWEEQAVEPAEASAPAQGWQSEIDEATEPALRSADAEGSRELQFAASPAQPAVGGGAEAPAEPVEAVAAAAVEDSIFAEEPAAAAPAAEPHEAPESAPPALVAEVERRIADLEHRLEQLTEARERLERQVAAQTEELRVQRAAIARTQRVVRSIAKSEEGATEPVPRAPGAS